MDHAALLAAIGRALGRDGPYEERAAPAAAMIVLSTGASPPTDASLRVLGGAASPAASPEGERVAWIEQRTEAMQGDYLPIEIDVRLAWKGKVRRVHPLETYNPYFGCAVYDARWVGDAFVYAYHEKHRAIAARLRPPYRAQSLVGLGGALQVEGDVAYHRAHDDEALLEGWHLAAWRAATPVPLPPGPRYGTLWDLGAREVVVALRPDFPDDPERWPALVEEAFRAGARAPLPPPEARALPRDRRPTLARLRALLAAEGASPRDADVLIAAAAMPFLGLRSPRGEGYGAVSRHGAASTPRWFPVYLHRHLRDHEGAAAGDAFLALLDRLAAAPAPAGWPEGVTDVPEGVARMALACVRRHAAALAGACREGAITAWRDPFAAVMHRRARPAYLPRGMRDALRAVLAAGFTLLPRRDP